MANPLEAFKKMPTWGKVAVGVGGAGVVYYAYRQHQNAASSSSSDTSSTDSTGIDPVTGMPYSQDNQIDPLTGMSYLAEAQEYGSVSAAESAMAGNASGSAYGSLGTYDSGYDNYSGGYYDNSGTDSGSTEAYSTNSQWAQAVEAGLSSIGYSPTDISGAVGRYLSSLPLTSAQASIIYAAIGEYGNPPVGQYTVVTQPGPPTTTGNDVKVPAVTGKTVDAADTALSQAGLTFNTETAKDKPGGYERIVTASDPKAGTSVAKGSHVGLTWHYVKSKPAPKKK
jgi:hypothetical protein